MTDMVKLAVNTRGTYMDFNNEAFESILDRKGIEWEHDTVGAGSMRYWHKGCVGDYEYYLSPHQIVENRSDPDLIAVIEKMGAGVNQQGANIEILTVPWGTPYFVAEDHHEGAIYERITFFEEQLWEIAGESDGRPISPLALKRYSPDSAPKGIPVLIPGGVGIKHTGGKWVSAMGNTFEELKWTPVWWAHLPEQEDF